MAVAWRTRQDVIEGVSMAHRREAKMIVRFEADGPFEYGYGTNGKMGYMHYQIKDVTGGVVNSDGRAGDDYYVLAYIPAMATAMWKADPEEFQRILLDGLEEYPGIRNASITVTEQDEDC